jgi:cyclopropane fatty-acyl-phospholipid synthase-like methyltransferase
MSYRTKDPVNQSLITLEEEKGLETIGLMNSAVWQGDPRRLIFTLARYKFVSKMFSGKKNVAEIGCGDGFCARIVKQEVEHLLITDYDPYFIKRFSQQHNEKWPIEAKVHDILKMPLSIKFDAIYSLDVMEHISIELENEFLKNICLSLQNNGVVIIGMPSLESQVFASPDSIAGHINCKTGENFKEILEQYFEQVFLFSMNDEVIHTGFTKMSHYLLTICCNPKNVE